MRPQPEALARAAAASGGVCVPAERSAEVFKRLMGLPEGETRTRVERAAVWNAWWLGALFFGLVCAEWTLRRWKAAAVDR
jgi:hypothetical protein